MRISIPLVIFLIMLVVVTGCQSNDEDLERMPGIDLPVQNMNTDLHLVSAENSNSFEMGDAIWLFLYNTADLPVMIDENDGMTIYKKSDENWEMVIDRIYKEPGNKWVPANGDEFYRWQTVIVAPAVFSTEPEQIRIVIVGNFVKDNGKIGKDVGAYIDVTLNPK